MVAKISDRLKNLDESPIRKLQKFADIAEKKGIKIYHLNIGDPDITSPKEILSQFSKLKNFLLIPYDNSKGNKDFLEALKNYYHKIGFKYLTKDNIQITSGGSEAISWAMFSVCNPEDEIIIFEPYYPNYKIFAKINGINITSIGTSIKNGYHLPKQEEIEGKISVKTKAILVNNPNNPTGCVYRKDEIELLINIAQKHNLYLFSDEVYREFIFGKNKHISLLSYMRDIPDKAILLDSISKRYSACGLRLGAIVSLNKDLMEGVLKMAQARLSAGFIDQKIVRSIDKVPDIYFNKVRKEYEKRRDLVYKELSSIHGVKTYLPDGAFYMIAELPVNDADNFCRWLLTDFNLDKETIMLTPAKGFYESENSGNKEVRIAYVISRKDLNRSMKILKEALRVYKN